MFWPGQARSQEQLPGDGDASTPCGFCFVGADVCVCVCVVSTCPYLTFIFHMPCSGLMTACLWVGARDWSWNATGEDWRNGNELNRH